MVADRRVRRFMAGVSPSKGSVDSDRDDGMSADVGRDASGGQ